MSNEGGEQPTVEATTETPTETVNDTIDNSNDNVEDTDNVENTTEAVNENENESENQNDTSETATNVEAESTESVENDNENSNEEGEVEDEVEEVTQLLDAANIEEEEEEEEEEEDALQEVEITLSGLNAYLQALDIPLDLPTIDLTNQGIGDQGIIELITKLEETKKLDTVSTLKLDGNDIEAEGAKKLADAIKDNSTITFLDLKWNMISVEGTKALAEALEHNQTLVSLNLDGNELGEDGAEVLALSLVRNRGLKYLELKDNMIGDAGATALANGLNGQNDLVLLDLTSNDIGAGGALAVAANLVGKIPDAEEDTKETEDGEEKKEGEDGEAASTAVEEEEPFYHLETLILNNNPIGDIGAIALGKGLTNNTTLRSLQLRKCAIHSEGVLGITEVLLSVNTTLAELDLNANNCGVRGEIALNDMMMNKPELYVEWKDASQQSIWTIDEIQEIIEHYGVAEILSNILRGFSLAPLIENYKLLGALSIEDRDVADNFVQEAFGEEFLVTGLSMIVTILTQGEDDDDDLEDDYIMEETKMTVDELPPMLYALHLHLPTLVELLKHPTYPKQKEEEDVPASSRAPPLGEARLKVLQFLTSLVKQNTSAVNERILELEIPDVILQLMFRHGLNNVLHCEVVKFMRSALHADTLKYTLIEKTKFLVTLIEKGKEQWGQEQGSRAGYSGHLAQLTEEVQKLDEDAVASKILEANELWQSFIATEFAAYNEETVWSLGLP